MLELMVLFAAAATEPAVPEAREEAPIDVRGSRVVCRQVTQSAMTRMGRQRVCRSQREWDEIRDQAVELLLDMPRRNPRQGGRTIPDPFNPAQ